MKSENASRFADALSRIGDLCRGVPMTLSVEQYLKRDNGKSNFTSKEYRSLKYYQQTNL